MSYSKEDYLTGKTPLPPHKIKKSKNKKYYYGVKESSRGKLHAFVCLEKNFKNQGIVRTYHCTEGNAQKAIKHSHKMLDDLKIKEKENSVRIKQSNNVPNVGDIVIHADGQGQHTALILSKNKLDSVLLFVTSNPSWGRAVREMTPDEQILIGHSLKKKTSYFVRVNRANDDLIPTGSKFPNHRITELRKEFCPWLNT